MLRGEEQMTNEEIQAVRNFGLRLIETEFAHFSRNGTDNFEYISAIKRTADTALVFFQDGGGSKTVCSSVKEELITRARELFVQEWMQPLEDDDEAPDAAEAVETFDDLLGGQ